MTTVLTTSFGSFRGKQDNAITQFLGIKYASLQHQLSPPTLISSYGSNVVDATEYGPRAPAMDGCAFEQSHLIQCTIGVPDHLPPMSGTECLNLNITKPNDVSSGGEKLPVMVFIHGGGFIMGANYWPQYDPSRLVRKSVELDMPVIVVMINYRLGILGNITSAEFRQNGLPGNNSLRDQQCALIWVQKHIAGFGGDPNEVTVFGESAGAAAVPMHLCSREKLFKRAISMSGTPLMPLPLPKPLTREDAEESYQAVLKALNLEHRSSEERIIHLEMIDVQDLVAKTPMDVSFVPFVDGELVLEAMTYTALGAGPDKLPEAIPGLTWCEDLVIGDCQHDGSVLTFMGLAERKMGIGASFENSMRNSLSPSASKAILDAYKIHSALSDDEALSAVIDIASDVAYYYPALAYARAFPGRAFCYHFNQPNPWEGPLKGMATHMLDAAFLFQNFNEHLPHEDRRVAEAIAKDFITFANGASPWPEYRKEDARVRVYEASNVSVGKNNDWNSGRRVHLWKLQEAGIISLDEFSRAWESFMSGK